MEKLLLCLLACVLASGQDLQWENSYDQPLNFTCPVEQSISAVKSIHDDHYEDRLWAFSCQDTFHSEPSCFWTGYMNEFDRPFAFICPSYSVMTGMRSYHDDHFEDRRWMFRCCKVDYVCNQNCKWTSYVNFFDEEISWEAPDQNYLAGVESYHDNKHEDRRWKYYYCIRNKC